MRASRLMALVPLLALGTLASCTDSNKMTSSLTSANARDTCDPKKQDCLAIGRMTGGGNTVTVGGAKVSKGLTLHCDITLSNNLEVNWAPANNWHLTKPIETATCLDDPTISP